MRLLLICRCLICNNFVFFNKTEEMRCNMEENILAAFGNRIKTLRNEIGLSQEKFALKIEMDRSYYASVEAGKRNIALKNIEKIAKGFEVPLEKLFEGM